MGEFYADCFLDSETCCIGLLASQLVRQIEINIHVVNCTHTNRNGFQFTNVSTRPTGQDVATTAPCLRVLGNLARQLEGTPPAQGPTYSGTHSWGLGEGQLAPERGQWCPSVIHPCLAGKAVYPFFPGNRLLTLAWLVDVNFGTRQLSLQSFTCKFFSERVMI